MLVVWISVESRKRYPRLRRKILLLSNPCPWRLASKCCNLRFSSRTAACENGDKSQEAAFFANFLPRLCFSLTDRRRKHSCCSLCGALFKIARRFDRRPLHRRSRKGEDHFPAGLHPNRREILFGDHGHWSGMARL